MTKIKVNVGTPSTPNWTVIDLGSGTGGGDPSLDGSIFSNKSDSGANFVGGWNSPEAWGIGNTGMLNDSKIRIGTVDNSANWTDEQFTLWLANGQLDTNYIWSNGDIECAGGIGARDNSFIEGQLFTGAHYSAIDQPTVILNWNSAGRVGIGSTGATGDTTMKVGATNETNEWSDAEFTMLLNNGHLDVGNNVEAWRYYAKNYGSKAQYAGDLNGSDDGWGIGNYGIPGEKIVKVGTIDSEGEFNGNSFSFVLKEGTMMADYDVVSGGQMWSGSASYPNFIGAWQANQRWGIGSDGSINPTVQIGTVNGGTSNWSYGPMTLSLGDNGALKANISTSYVRSPSGIPFKPSVTDAGVLTWVHATLAYDLFDRTSTTTLSSANVGGAWTAVSGTWGAISNEAYMPSDSALGIAILPTVGTGDYVLSCSVKGTIASPTVNRVPTLVFRYIDANNYLCVWINNSSIVFSKNDGNVWSNFDTVSQTTTDGTSYLIRIRCKGNNIKVWVDGVPKVDRDLTGGDATKFGTSGITGIRMTKQGSPATAARWNNFIVESV